MGIPRIKNTGTMMFTVVMPDDDLADDDYIVAYVTDGEKHYAIGLDKCYTGKAVVWPSYFNKSDDPSMPTDVRLGGKYMEPVRIARIRDGVANNLIIENLYTAKDSDPIPEGSEMFMAPYNVYRIIGVVVGDEIELSEVPYFEYLDALKPVSGMVSAYISTPAVGDVFSIIPFKPKQCKTSDFAIATGDGTLKPGSKYTFGKEDVSRGYVSIISRAYAYDGTQAMFSHTITFTPVKPSLFTDVTPAQYSKLCRNLHIKIEDSVITVDSNGADFPASKITLSYAREGEQLVKNNAYNMNEDGEFNLEIPLPSGTMRKLQLVFNGLAFKVSAYKDLRGLVEQEPTTVELTKREFNSAYKVSYSDGVLNIESTIPLPPCQIVIKYMNYENHFTREEVFSEIFAGKISYSEILPYKFGKNKRASYTAMVNGESYGWKTLHL